MEKVDKATWQRVKFGEVARSLNSAVRDPLAAGIERYVGLEHIESHSLHIKSWGLVADGVTFTRTFKKGNVLFGKRRAYQRKAAIADFDGLCSGDILVLEAKADTLLPELLPFLVHSDGFFDHAVRTSAGSLSPRTKFQDLADYEFLLPPRGQQARLAELLLAADEVGEGYETMRQQLQTTQSLFVEGEIYQPSITKQPLDSVVIDIIAGTSLNGNNAEYISPDEYAVLKVSAVGAKGFEPSESKVLTKQDEFLPKYAVNAGDMLITRANGSKKLVGRICLVEEDYPNLMLCDKTLRIVVDEEKASKRYLVAALKSRDARKQIEDIATGAGGSMKNLTQAGIKSIRVPLPPLDKQLTQVKRLDNLQAQEREAEGLITHTYAVKKALINQIFSA